MGYSEENTPLNQQPQQQQQQQNQTNEPYPNPALHGYSAYPPYGSYPPFQQGQVYPQGIPVPYNSQYGAPPGYVVAPHALYQPILQRREDRVGSHGSVIVGALLGFFFPVLSLLAFCCSRKLRLKHGVCVGHAIYYLIAVVGFFITASIYSNQVVPFVCHDLNGCYNDVSNGTDSQYWSSYVTSCNTTRYIGGFDATPYSKQPSCELPPFGADPDFLGPQTPSCATCVCDRKQADCQSAQSISLFSWIAGPASLLLAMVALSLGRYYRRLIAEESMSVYRL